MENKIRVFEAFAGYGSQAMALKRAGIPHEVIGISEIDKYAIQAYSAVHGETKNYGDISKIEWSQVPDFDFFTYSFPCTDISNAGIQKGFSEGSGTRSSLLWECRKAIEAKMPKYLMMENVKALVSKKFMPDFLKWEEWIRKQGYTNFWQVLNAKDYGVPQNRERVFMVSVLGEARYQFPEKFPLEKRLKDVLEEKVDEKYYLKPKNIEWILQHAERHKKKGTGFAFKPKTRDDVANCLRANGAWCPTDNAVVEPADRPIRLGNIYGEHYNTGYAGNVWDVNGISPALMTMQGGGRQPMIKESTDKIIKVGNYHKSGHNASVIVSGEGSAPTVMENHGTVTAVVEPVLRIPQATKQGYAEVPPGSLFDASYPDSKTRRGRVQDGGQVSPTLTAGGEPPCYYEGAVLAEAEGIREEPVCVIGSMQKNAYKGSADGPSPCITSACGMGGGQTPMVMYTNFRIRKLTPRECFRLMGLDDFDIDFIQMAGISNSQQYKMAGNSIVVDVLVEIFKNLFNGK